MIKMEGHIDYNYWNIEEKKKYLDLIPEGINNILDIGCGNGELLWLLKEKKYNLYGCDIDEICLEKCSKVASVKKIDILELSQFYKINSFDMVTCIHILEHVKNPYKALEEIKLITKPNGYLLLAIPNARNIIWDERETHLFSWNYCTIKNFLKESGWRIIKINEDFVNCFPNILRSSPIINRILLKIFISSNEIICLCQNSNDK